MADTDIAHRESVHEMKVAHASVLDKHNASMKEKEELISGLNDLCESVAGECTEMSRTTKAEKKTAQQYRGEAHQRLEKWKESQLMELKWRIML